MFIVSFEHYNVVNILDFCQLKYFLEWFILWPFQIYWANNETF